jgi:hypothetical protein
VAILEYGCELWEDCCIRDTQKLECLQLETARIVTGLPIYSSAEIYILKLGGQNWKTVGSLGNSIYFIKLQLYSGRKERLGTSLQTTPLSAIVIIITEIICYCFSNSRIHVVYVVIYLRMLFIFILNVHFINTIELLCLTILITLFPSR